MISKLPKWVWVGGAFLSLIAGMINAIGFLSFQHQGVTHLTGITTQLGSSVATQQWIQALHLLAVIVSFVFGSMMSGFIIQDSVLKFGQRYGIALVCESFLLFLAVPFLNHHQMIGAYLTSCACGLQNAMASTYSGAVLRTTHVSGLFTDIGLLIGQSFHSVKVDKKRIFLNTILVCSFFVGSIIGNFLFNKLFYNTLYIPSLLLGGLGLGYGVSRISQRVKF